MNKQRPIDSMNKRDNYATTNSTRRSRINKRRHDAAKTTRRIERPNEHEDTGTIPNEWSTMLQRLHEQA